MVYDIFSEINDAVLDLQSSHSQTYFRPLKKLSELLRHSCLEVYRQELIEGIDLESFIHESEETGRGMHGSAQLQWPSDSKKVLGITLLLLDKLGSDPDYTLTFSHFFFYSGKQIISSIHTMTGQLIVPFVRDFAKYVQSNRVVDVRLNSVMSRKIFIVHGHDEGARESVARFVERLGFDAIILHEQANQGKTVIEKIIEHGDVGFAIVLLTPDDEGRAINGELELRARQNVLLELGYFIARLGREKVCTLRKGNVSIPSDFAGVVWENMDSNGGWKYVLGRELKAAGFEIDFNNI